MHASQNDFGSLQVLLVKMTPPRLAMLKTCEEYAKESLPKGHVIFREPVPKFDHSRLRSLICFIHDDKNIVTHLAIGRRGFHPGGTGQSQIEFTSAWPVIPEIPLAEIFRLLETQISNLARRALENNGLLPPKTSQSVLNALVQLSPSAQRIVDQALKSYQNPICVLSAEKQFFFQQQQDSVLMSLDFAGLDRKEFLRPDFDSNKAPISYLAGLSEVRLREGAMLTNDSSRMPGFEKIYDWVQNAKTFSDGRTTLTIHLVHEQPLEGLVGTDLIYYNETYKSFIMVQYKAMEKEGPDHVFRLPNEDLNREVSNMLVFRNQLEGIKNSQLEDPQSYRLNFDPFFLKFCPRVVREPDEIELIQGMYLPLDYWHKLETSPALDGKRGGKALRYDNVGRYLTNTDFTALVRNAWAGTHLDQSALLEKVIRKSLETGRAVTFAQACQSVDHSCDSE